MVRNFHEDLKSRWLFVDVSEGFIVVLEGVVLLLGKLLHSSVPLPFYFVKGLVDLSFDPSLLAGVVILLFAFPFVLGDFSVGRGGCGGWCEGGCGFLGFESSLVGDSNGEGWW